jgi:hypothetical protein
MSQPSIETGQGGHFIPLAAMPGWTQAMHRASRAHRLGQVLQAMGFYHAALGQAHEQVEAGHTDNADACLAALVSSSLCLSELQVEQGCRSQAAAVIADAHTTLVRLILGQPCASAWRKAAVWHSRDTHEALVNHWQAHGPDPVIVRALRAGCLVINATARPVH